MIKLQLKLYKFLNEIEHLWYMKRYPKAQLNNNFILYQRYANYQESSRMLNNKVLLIALKLLTRIGKTLSKIK